MRYDLNDLRLFLSVVEEGSITAGARRLHLSLPSASARVRQLEQQAGVDLLVRERRGVRPTPAGATLQRHAREVLTHTAKLESAVASYTRPRKAALRLLAGGSAMHRLVPAVLISFLTQHTDIDVHVRESHTPDTVRLLRDGKADLGVLVDQEVKDCGLLLEPLGDDSLVAIGQKGGVLAGRDTVSFREVAEHPMVGLSAGTSLRRWIETRLGPQAPEVRYRTTAPDLGVLSTLAAAGVGLAVVPRREVDPEQELDMCALQDAWARRFHLLAWGVTDGPPSADVEALAAHLRQAAARQGNAIL